MSRTKRTTILTIAAVATLLAALATPVSAKKPDKPTPTVEIVKVSMELVTDEFGDLLPGLATTDECGGPLEMKVEAGGRLRVDWADARRAVEMNLPDLNGCHGWKETEDAFAGYFILKAKPGGTVELTSRFDYIWGETVTQGNKKKPRVVVQVQDLYQIDVLLERTDSDPFDWAASGPQWVTGDLELSHFARADGGWQDPIIVHDFVMTITILPSD